MQKKDQNLLELLGKQFRLQAFLFESTQGVRSLELRRGLGPIDGKHVAEQLTSNGQVTDLGGAITDLAHRNPSSSLAGLVMFSDFNKTTGPDPARAAQQFGAKIYTVGVGATRAVNLAVKIDAPSRTRRRRTKCRSRSVLQPTGLEGQTTRVRLYAEPLGGGSGSRTLIGEKQSPPLSGPTQTVEFIYKPEQAGRVHLLAEVDRLPGEVNRGEEPGPRRDQRAGRLPAADVRRVRADLGVAIHQGGLPPRSAGGHEGLPHVPLLLRSRRCGSRTSCSCRA